ncbi:unnamed protein product [Periconia digitata]|uniref:Uncharacterized protein n=1 Tax=Periconia digitata TaxID=1303443 RepID=A0A9W4UUL6_9PLEO|nr:unnamed protein product [Periconia digitata]
MAAEDAELRFQWSGWRPLMRDKSEGDIRSVRSPQSDDSSLASSSSSSCVSLDLTVWR